MIWKKQGFIFAPTGSLAWMQSHAQVPTAIEIDGKLCVFFATRNADKQSQIARIDLDLHHPERIIALHADPILTIGNPGTFDEDGVMPSSLLKMGNEIWLYYTGWNKKVSTPYHNAIGVACSQDGGVSFQRRYQGPILDRTMEEPFLAITPCVIKTAAEFKMWYASGTEWVLVDGKREPVYVIKYASSDDGLRWKRSNRTCIIPQHAQEALCTPTVVIEDGLFHMWFSYRDSLQFRESASGYRIGYATSHDGINWQRDDEAAGITLSAQGWDANMICYPNLFLSSSKQYLFFNGNQFGATGFGYAVRERGAIR